MSSEEFNGKLEESKKLVMSIKKDLRYRQDQQKRGETTYSVDAEIRGSMSQLDQLIQRTQSILSNFRSNPKDFGLTNKELDKRNQQFNAVVNEASALKRQYEACFTKKARDNLLGEAQNKQKTNYSNMKTKDLLTHKQKQQQDQEQALDELIGVVKNVKKGGKQISTELQQQDQLLNELDRGMDENTQGMGKVKRNMMKLLDQSSNCCLMTVIIIQIVAIVLVLVLM